MRLLNCLNDLGIEGISRFGEVLRTSAQHSRLETGGVKTARILDNRRIPALAHPVNHLLRQRQKRADVGLGAPHDFSQGFWCELAQFPELNHFFPFTTKVKGAEHDAPRPISSVQ